MSRSALSCLAADLSTEPRSATASLWFSPEWYVPSLAQQMTSAAAIPAWTQRSRTHLLFLGRL